MRSHCYRLSFLIFYLLLAPLSAQDYSLDSLEQLYHSNENDSLRWKAAIDLADKWSFIQTDSAFKWAERSFQLAHVLKDEQYIARSLYQLGATAYDKRDLSQAMDYFLQALERFKAQGDERWQMDTELEIGLIYQDQKAYRKARASLDRFYQYYLGKGKAEAPSIIFALNQYVVLFEQMGEIDSMLHYSRASLEAAEYYQQTKYLANLHNNLASVYLYTENYSKAKHHFQAAEQIGFGTNVIGRYYNFYALADMYHSLNQADSSIYCCHKALEVARSFGDIEKEANIHRLMADVFQQNQEYRQAYAQIDTFLLLKDSIVMIRQEEMLSELTIQYETQQKEAQIARQELELQRAANRRNRILFFSIAGFLLLGGLLLYMRNQQHVKSQQAELALKYQKKEAKRLRELDQLKSNFFANISHEFRTPLTLLLSPLREMSRGRLLEKRDNYLKQMTHQAERLLQLVNQILELSRLESGRIELEEESCDLVAFMRLQLGFFESWAAQKNIQLRYQLPDEQLWVLLDRDKLEKILNNLLSNALKYTPEGGYVDLQLIPEKAGQQLNAQIRISNDGPGISEAHLPYIFERFYRGDNELDTQATGAGIGLALTRELIRFMGGEIQVENQPGLGTTFVIDLPLKKSTSASDSYSRETSTVSTSIASPLSIETEKKEAPLVLVVEDNIELRAYICDQLSNQYRVIEAGQGEQGLELAMSEMPELVISDIRMPKMDGLTFSRKLKTDERSSHIPLILLTALSEREDLHAGLSTGTDAYLTKPFDAEELRLRVHHLIDQRRKLREKFAQALQEGPDTPVVENPVDAAFLDRVKNTVLSQLDNENLSIESLGREIGMSRSQLHRKLKALTGQSPSIFVRTLRLQHAYRLLKQGWGNVSEVAHEVGMPNLSHFSRSFKEQFGVPPSALSNIK